MDRTLKIVHYINQFYAQYGAEEAAGMGIVVKEEAVGPGKLLEQLTGGRGKVAATVICGDNYISENLEKVTEEITDLVEAYSPDIFIAGPGFNAGRYGLACGSLTAAVKEKLKIPAVTGLYEENPGAELYSGLCYIVGTENSARHMRGDLEKVIRFALKLADGADIGSAKEEGYLGTGPIRDINYQIPGPKRAVDMALDKYYGRHFVTEVPMPVKEIIPPSRLTKPINEATVALVTDGGLVPKGNPDRMVPVNSVKFAQYSINGKDSLAPEDYEVRHQGYDNTYVLEDPNRLVPVDSMRWMEKKGRIGRLFPRFFTTAGVMTTLENGKKFGKGIAEILKQEQVDAVILTST